MSIKPNCDKCKKELTDYGGILLSPPDNNRKVIKYHLCSDCCQQMEKLIENNQNKNEKK